MSEDALIRDAGFVIHERTDRIVWRRVVDNKLFGHEAALRYAIRLKRDRETRDARGGLGKCKA